MNIATVTTEGVVVSSDVVLGKSSGIVERKRMERKNYGDNKVKKSE